LDWDRPTRPEQAKKVKRRAKTEENKMTHPSHNIYRKTSAGGEKEIERDRERISQEVTELLTTSMASSSAASGPVAGLFERILASSKRQVDADGILMEGGGINASEHAASDNNKKNNTLVHHHDFDDDEILPDETVQDLLNWRKQDSFSDWTIVISVIKNAPHHQTTRDEDDGREEAQEEERGDDDTTCSTKELTFHVHKQNLACGPRRSEYFVKLFANKGNFAESHDNTSRIELTELAAAAFPALLDYMYMVGQKMTFCTETATALYSLAKYFDVRRLRHDVKQFCFLDMRQADTCGTYYEHATMLQEHAILEPATKYCRDNIYYINNHTSRLLHVADAQFWLDLMEERVEKGTMSNVSKKVSIHICMFCQNHKVSPEVFRQLTDERYLVENNGIHPLAAISLLYWEHVLLVAAEPEPPTELSSLQMRCINTIVRNKEGADLKGKSGHLLLTLSPLVLRELVTRLAYGIP
jgi:BTB/POZ domain